MEPLERRAMLAVVSGGTVLLDDIPVWSGRGDGAAAAAGQDAVYFARYQSDSQARVEVWKSDGTAAGTVKLLTARGNSGSATTTGATASVRDFAVTANGNLYFSDEGFLYLSDGTGAPAQPITSVTMTDPTPGTFQPQLRKIVTLGDAAYVANGSGDIYRVSGATATRLPISQGVRQMTATADAVYFATSNGVYRVTGTSPSLVKSAVVTSPLAADAAGRVYFTAYNSLIGKVELWRSDSATAVAALPITSSSGGPGEMTVAGNLLYFTVDGALWRSDGIAAGTTLLLDLIPNFTDGVTELTAVGETLYFSARDNDGFTDLYRTDGTAEGTQRLTTNNLRPNAMTAAGAKLYFHGFANDGAGEELWTTDTAGGLSRVTDLRPGQLSSVFGTPLALGERIFFHGIDPVLGAGMYVSDGTAGGTAMLRDYNEGLMNARVEHAPGSDGSMYYAGMHNWSRNIELLRAAGTPDGGPPQLVKEIHTTTSVGSFPEDLINVNGTIFFTAVGRTSGRELWKSDGTDAGTVMVKELSARTSSTEFSQFRAVGNLLYFYAQPFGSSPPPEGWYKSDGTDAGTVLVNNAPPAPPAPGATEPFPTDRLSATSPITGWTYFAENSSFAINLKRTKNNTVETVKSWSVTGGGSTTFYPRGLSFIGGDKLVFTVRDDTYGAEPWVYNETTRTTTLLRNIIPEQPGRNPIETSSSPSGFFVRGNWVYFAATDNEHGRELWRTDGTPNGTSLFLDLTPGTGSAGPVPLGFFGGKQMFLAGSPETGTELFLTDGTVDGTRLLYDINPGPANSGITTRFLMDGRMYFLADDGVHGRELWVTDGTAANTLLVGDVAPGTVSSNAMNFTNVNGVLWFTANDGIAPQWFRVAPPAANVAATYAVSPGWHIPLSGAGATTVDPNETLSYAWDLDDDGVFGETGAAATRGNETGAKVTFNAPDISVGTAYRVELRVSDSTGLATMATSVVTVDDLAGVTRGAGAHYQLVDTGGEQTLTLAGGEIVVASNLGVTLANLTLDVQLGAVVTLAAPQTLARLAVDAPLAVAPGGGNTIITRGLALGHDGRLDLADNDLVLDYEAAAASPLADVEALVAGGYHYSAWDGPGLITSADAARQGVTTLAVAEAANVLFIGATETAMWSGVTVDGSAILVKYTYSGDVNLDGLIDGADYGAIDNWVQFPGTHGYANGDVNYDGLIDGADYGLIDNAIQFQGEPL